MASEIRFTLAVMCTVFLGILLSVLAIGLTAAEVQARREESIASMDTLVAKLRTQVELPNAIMTVPVIGDWGRQGSATQLALRNALDAWSEVFMPKAIFSVGDNFYTHGVKDNNDPLWTESWSGVYHTMSRLSTLDWYVIVGNHDYRGNLTSQLSYNLKDARWHMPNLYYTLDIAGPEIRQDASINDKPCVRVIFLDTCPFVQRYYDDPENPQMLANLQLANTTAQLEWLNSQLLAENQCTATIVIGHQPIYSAGMHGDSGDLQARLLPIITARKSDGSRVTHAYIAGHDHVLMHLSDDSQYDYIISGAGSDIRTDSHSHGYLRWQDETNGFSIHSVNATHISHAFIGADASVLHAFTRSLAG